MFKRLISPRELLIIALLALSLAACTAAVRADSQAAPAPATGGVPRTITVVGVGQVKLVPDVAQINVGAEARAPTVSEAKAEVDRQMAAIVAALTELGIAEKDIQTSHYSIHFERDRDPAVMRARPEEGPLTEAAPAPIQGGYRVSNMLRVIVRDIEQAGDVLDAVVAAGANQVHGVTFTVSDETEWQSVAREKAMADARDRAAELAGLAGVELGEVLTVSEIVGSAPVVMPAMAERAFGGGGIAPGELEFGTQVQVTFAIQ